MFDGVEDEWTDLDTACFIHKDLKKKKKELDLNKGEKRLIENQLQYKQQDITIVVK